MTSRQAKDARVAASRDARVVDARNARVVATHGAGSTVAQGAAAEAAAARLLEARGLRVVARNFRVKGGEIDLVCHDGDVTVFVEVRLRRRSDFGGAAASITATKQARLILAARHWLARHGETPCRFDAVVSDGETMEWLRDAFQAD